MKLTRSELRQIIAETIDNNSLDEGFMDSVKGFFGMGSAEAPPKPQLDSFEVSRLASEITDILPFNDPKGRVDPFDFDLAVQGIIIPAVMNTGNMKHLDAYRAKAEEIRSTPSANRITPLRDLFSKLAKYGDAAEVENFQRQYERYILAG